MASRFSFAKLLAWAKWCSHLARGRAVPAEPSSYELVRWLFLRALGLIYLIAFLSLWAQLSGLVGRDGILPAERTMAALREQADNFRMGWGRYAAFPTLCWFGAGDGWLQFQCGAGTALGLLLLAGLAPAPCLFLLWALYLSLATICREFLAFQWDLLLLETGFLAIFLAPLQWRPRLWRAPPPLRPVLWLFRWLLFRLMFSSGCVKLLSGDLTWRHLRALDFHYQTQPLPTWVGWYAHQLPRALHTSSTLLMFAVELILPFFIFGSRRMRQTACAGFALLQSAILLTGNYGFFNLLTLALCLWLLDDDALRRVLPQQWPLRQPPSAAEPGPAAGHSSGTRHWPSWLIGGLAGLVILVSALQFCGMLTVRPPFRRLLAWVAPFRTINSYGLFAVMTTARPEIVIQGSRDGVAWLDYGRGRFEREGAS